MDEHKLADALRDAVREVPPPSFNEQDVVTASHRASARQRRMILTGSTFGAALLVGGTLVAVNLFGPEPITANTATSGEGTAEGSVLMIPSQDSATGGQAGPGSERASPKTSPEPSKQGDGSASTGPSIGGTEGCGMADRELAAALAVELPAVASRTPEQAPADLCMQGSRGFALKLPEGTLTVSLGPDSGLSRSANQGGSGPGGTQTYTAVTTRGAPLTLHSAPVKPGGKAPFAADLERVAKKLADKY